MKRYLFLLLLFLIQVVPSMAAWTMVRNSTTYCGDSATTCTITVTSPTAGNLLLIGAMFNATAATPITTASGDGTWTHPGSCASNDGVKEIDWIYNLSASAGTSITVNFSGTGQFVDIFYFEYSGSSPFSFDTCAIQTGTGSPFTNPPAGSITTTGSNDLAVAAVKGDQTIASGSAVSPSPWTTPVLVANGDEAVDHALNFAATTTQALFTASAASYTNGSTIAFKDSTSTSSFIRRRVSAIWTTNRSDGGAASSGGGGTYNLASQIYNDNTGTNEGRPQLPFSERNNFDFDFGPVQEDGNNVSNNPTCSANGNVCAAVEAWGTVFVDMDPSTGATHHTSTNTRVNIRNLSMWWLDNTGHWTKGVDGTTTPDDGAYPEDFSSGQVTDDVRTEADGTISVRPPTGDCSHYFAPFPRIPITASKWVGVVIYVEVRLILDNPAGVDDRANSYYLANVGGDYYPSTTGAGIENNPGIGGGKYKYVSNNWRSIAMTTLTLAQLQANPPPIDLSGDLP